MKSAHYLLLLGFALPLGLTTIDSDAFKGCAGLTSVQVPVGVTSLGGFQNCTNMETINISNTVTTLASNTFRGCTKLTAVSIPGSVTKIDQYAFSGTGFKTITIPATVKFGSSDSAIFSDCLCLETAVIEDRGTTSRRVHSAVVRP